MSARNLFFAMPLVLSVVALGCSGNQTESQAPGTDTLQTQAGEMATDTAAPATEPATQAQAPETKPEVKKPAAKPEPKTMSVTLPESTQIAVVLLDSIDTDVHVTGDGFKGQLAQVITVDGKMVFDSGAAVTGVLDSVVESGRLNRPAELKFSLRTIEGPNGPVPVNTYQIHEKKSGKTARDVALIGGGAVVGGVIGKITGKKGGTEIGAAAGAAAGAGAAAATGKQDIVHSAGTQATFLLKKPLTVTVPK